MAKDDPTGTPDDPQDDGSATATGTPDDGRDDGSGEPHPSLEEQLAEERRKNAQLLSEKQNRDEAVRKAVEEERARGIHPSTAQNGLTPQQQQYQQAEVAAQAAYTKAQEWAAKGDPAAILSLANLEKSLAIERRMADESAFRTMSREEELAARKEYGTGQYATPQAALKAARGELFAQEKPKWDETAKRLEVEAKAKQDRENGVRSTSVRGLGPAETKAREMTQDQVDQQIEKLPRLQRMTWIRENIDSGKVRVRG